MVTESDILRNFIKSKGMSESEFWEWDSQRLKALKGKKLLDSRRFEQECIDLYLDWCVNCPEKLKVNYKKGCEYE